MFFILLFKPCIYAKQDQYPLDASLLMYMEIKELTMYQMKFNDPKKKLHCPVMECIDHLMKVKHGNLKTILYHEQNLQHEP